MQFVPPPTDLPGELVLLAAERTVTVTHEEHHQDALAGRTGRVVVELRPCRITSGKHAGQDGLEVRLDGRRVGELTHLMAERYLPVVDDLAARGRRAGCEALVQEDARGIQVELRLPAAQPTASGLPAVRHPVHAVPRRRPRPLAPPPTTVTPVPHVPGRRSRRLLGVAGAAAGVLVLASAIGTASRDDAPVSTAAMPSAIAAPMTYAQAAPEPQPASPKPVHAPVDEPVVAPAQSATARARAAAPATSEPAARASAPTSKPASRPVPAAPKAALIAEPEPADESSGCDSNYSGCVPVASDVDCEGGNGNGPAYVSGPVRVTGTDIYDLDRDKNGIACE